MKRGRLVVAVAVAIASFASSPVSAAPGNDSVASAQAVTVPGVYAGSSVGAGTEPLEPLECGSGHTVWYRFTVVSHAPVIVHARRGVSAFDPWVAVYSGSVFSSPTSHGCQVSGPIGLVAEPGATYWIQIGTRGASAGGPFNLSLGIGTTVSGIVAGGYAYSDGAGVGAAALAYVLLAGGGVIVGYRSSEGGSATVCVFWFFAALCPSFPLPRPPGP